jgi:hypothetical protein
MPTEMSEYLVGAYLKLVLGCSVVDYNARPPGGGLEGLGELDVIGFDFANRKAYFCEVTTHLDGLLIGKDGAATMTKLESPSARVCRQASPLAGFRAPFHVLVAGGPAGLGNGVAVHGLRAFRQSEIQRGD